MWTWAAEPLDGQRHAQMTGPGDSEVLVLLVPW